MRNKKSKKRMLLEKSWSILFFLDFKKIILDFRKFFLDFIFLILDFIFLKLDFKNLGLKKVLFCLDKQRVKNLH